jgi:Transmembrane amino acid transporter protein
MVLVIGMGYTALDTIVSNDNQQSLALSVWIVIGGITFLIFALIPNLDHQWMLSLVGVAAGIIITVMVIAGSGIAMSDGSRDDYDQGHDGDFYGSAFGDDRIEYIMGVFDAFGIIALAYGGHSVLPDVQASLKPPSQHEDLKKNKTAAATVDGLDDDLDLDIQSWRHNEMKKGLMGAYMIIAPCYFLVGVVGYAAFGSTVSGFVVDDISNYISSNIFIGLVWILIMINAIAMGAVYVQAAFILIEDMFPTFFVVHHHDDDDDHKEVNKSESIVTDSVDSDSVEDPQIDGQDNDEEEGAPPG